MGNTFGHKFPLLERGFQLVLCGGCHSLCFFVSSSILNKNGNNENGSDERVFPPKGGIREENILGVLPQPVLFEFLENSSAHVRRALLYWGFQFVTSKSGDILTGKEFWKCYYLMVLVGGEYWAPFFVGVDRALCALFLKGGTVGGADTEKEFGLNPHHFLMLVMLLIMLLKPHEEELGIKVNDKDIMDMVQNSSII